MGLALIGLLFFPLIALLLGCSGTTEEESCTSSGSLPAASPANILPGATWTLQGEVSGSPAGGASAVMERDTIEILEVRDKSRTIRFRLTQDYLNKDGKVVATEAQEPVRSLEDITGLGPVTDLLWEQHRKAWMEFDWTFPQEGVVEANPSVTHGAIDLDGRCIDILKFSVTQELRSLLGTDAVMERTYGYTIGEGIMATLETRLKGRISGRKVSFVQDLVIDQYPPATP